MKPANLIAAGFSANQVGALLDGEQPSSDVITTINTVGAGTLTAAGLVGGVILRTGAQSGTAFSDATDTAVAIVAGIPNAAAGESVQCVIKNSTNATMTITAGTGVTLAGQTVIAANSWTRFSIVCTSLTAVAMTGIQAGPNANMPNNVFITITANGGQLTAAQMAGANSVYINLTTQAGATFATPSAASIFAAIPGAESGITYGIRFINNNSGTATISGGTGVSAVGTMTLSTGITRDFTALVNSSTSVTFQNVGSLNI